MPEMDTFEKRRVPACFFILYKVIFCAVHQKFILDVANHHTFRKPTHFWKAVE